MYVNAKYIRYLARECVAQQRTTEATHYLMPPDTLCGKECVVTVRDTDIARSAYVDKAQSSRCA